MRYEISFINQFKKHQSFQIQVSRETRIWDMTDGKTITSKYLLVGNIIYGNIKATVFVKIDDSKKVTLEDFYLIIK